MKRLFFAVIAAMSIFCSCSKNTEGDCPLEGVSVKISFADQPLQSRSFFTTSSVAKPWEKQFSSITVFVCNGAEKIVVQRNFSTAEITSKSASFALVGVNGGETCDFFVIANMGAIPSVATKSALLSLLESNADMYNGTFSQVSTGAKRIGGFVMSGSASRRIAAGSVTDVAVTLKRTVAKIAIQTSQSAGFGSLYSGAVQVKRASICGAASQTPLIKSDVINTGAMNFSFTQQAEASASDYQNLFYIYENETLDSGNRLILSIDAVYDSDGNFSTTADQTPLIYTTELDGEGKGDFVRNGYYRVSVSLDGLTGGNVTVSITVSDRESPVTQSVELGS